LNKVSGLKQSQLDYIPLIFTGAVAPSWLALLAKNIDAPKGAYVWSNKEIVDWVNGPVPECTAMVMIQHFLKAS